MIFSKLGETYQAAADSLISGSIASIISAMTPVITTGIIIYFMITGYMVIEFKKAPSNRGLRPF